MYLIKIINTQQTYLCPGEKNLLQGMECQGKDGIPVECRGGGCGICKIQIIAGSWQCKKMSTSVLTPAERQRNIVLACCCYPQSSLILKVNRKIQYRLEKSGSDCVR